MIKNWDEEEAVKDAKTWETVEGGESAMNYILNKYIVTREDKKINPSKQTAEEVLDLFTNTLLFDKEFHQFALDNYRVLIEYDKNENVLDIVKIKDYED
ncbi:MAG TPA: hypothetical protein VJ583_07215 [Nitrososphaeraceae archaeon]|nr:hypothetical protein [Nitrososphaeraceae archaeon]